MKRLFVIIGFLLIPTLLWAGSDALVIRNWKFTHSGAVDIGLPCPADGAPCATAWWNFEQAVAGTYPDDLNGYVMTVNGAMDRRDDYTHPRGFGAAEGYSWEFTGADYFNRADDDTFDPAAYASGDMQVAVVFTPHTVAAGEECLVAKYETTANQKGWKLCRDADDMVLTISADGAADTTVTHLNCLAAFRPAYISAVYDSSATTATVFVDNGSTANAAMAASVFNSTADFEIGASDTGATLLNGEIHDVKVYMDLASIDSSAHGMMLTQWQGRMSSQGHTLNITGASPPSLPLVTVASGIEPFILEIPVDTAYIGEIVDGSGGHYSPDAKTSKWWRGSCETCAAGHPTGWNITENGGAGAATVVIDCDTTTSAHGGTSLKFTADAGAIPKYAHAQGACQTLWIGQDVTLFTQGIAVAGAPDCTLRVFEFANADCTGFLAATAMGASVTTGANWVKSKRTMAAAGWNGATSSWKPAFWCAATGTAYEANFDYAQAYQVPTTWDGDHGCCSDADADCVSTTNINIDNSSPLTAGNWTVRGTWRQPQDGAETTNKIIFENDPTAGNNNRVRVSHDTDLLRCSVWDSGGVERAATVAAAINADTDSDWEIYHSNTGRVGCCYKDHAAAAWTCGVEAANAIMDGASLNYNLGVDDNVWVQLDQFYPRLLR